VAQLTLQLVCTAEDGPLFRVSSQITAADGIDTAVFVHSVGELEVQDAGLRIATVKDLADLPTVRGSEGTLYRKTTMVLDYADILKAQQSKEALVERVALLASQYTTYSDDFAGTFTHVLPEA
jgi:hypothetical protein